MTASVDMRTPTQRSDGATAAPVDTLSTDKPTAFLRGDGATGGFGLGEAIRDIREI